jgi:hypothetical protein
MHACTSVGVQIVFHFEEFVTYFSGFSVPLFLVRVSRMCCVDFVAT